MKQENNFEGAHGATGEKGPIGGDVLSSVSSFIPRLGISSYPEVPENIPGSLLKPDELGALQEIATFLKNRCDRLSPIGDDYEERKVALLQQQHRNNAGDKAESVSQPQLTVTVARYAGQDDKGNCSHGRIPHASDVRKQNGLQCIVEPIGRSGDNPVDSILWDMRKLINKIETLCDTGILQTIQDPSAVRLSPYLSEDGCIHVRTDIAIDTSNLLSQLNIQPVRQEC